MRMTQAPKEVKKVVQSTKVAQVAKPRFPVTDSAAVEVKEAMGHKFGSISKDNVILTLADEIGKELNGKKVSTDVGFLHIGLGDAEKIARAFATTMNEASKTAASVLNATDSDINSVSIWSPVTSMKATRVASTVRGNPALLLPAKEIKAAMLAEGATEADVEENEDFVAAVEVFNASKAEVDNSGKVTVRAKGLQVSADGETQIDIVRNRRVG